MNPAIQHVLNFFEYAHLPPRLQAISKPFCELAHQTAESSDNPETTVALRKLLEAKDAAVRAVMCLTVAIAALLVSSTPTFAGSWRPTLTGTIDRSTIVHGETIHITYQSPDATGCAFNIIQWGQWIGWADGVSLPTSGVLQITPALPGTYVVTIAVAKRRFNINDNLATVEGHRRTATISFPITVIEPGKPRDAWDDESPFQAKLWFDPPSIKIGEATTRYWRSSGANAYLDGQRVPAEGSDVLYPRETIVSTLQVTAGKRWQWRAVDRATVVVTQ